jgi:hypothetical protein
MKIINVLIAIFILMAGTVYGQTPQIDAVSPTQNELNVAVNTSISVTFDIDMDAATINNSTHKNCRFPAV